MYLYYFLEVCFGNNSGNIKSLYCINNHLYPYFITKFITRELKINYMFILKNSTIVENIFPLINNTKKSYQREKLYGP